MIEKKLLGIEDIPALFYLSSKLKKPFTFLDLETTTFLSQKNFGITEIGWLTIYPNQGLEYHDVLVNPENPICNDVVLLNGITNEMVAEADAWGQVLADKSMEWAENHIVFGFNAIGFDFKAIEHENRRYKNQETHYLDQRDVRSYWRIFNKSSKGKLINIADEFGIQSDNAHRALSDVIMTVKIMEKLLDRCGLDFFHHPAGKRSAMINVEKLFIEQRSQVQVQYISREKLLNDWIEHNPFDEYKLASYLKMSVLDLGFLMGDMLSERSLNADLIKNEKAMFWLSEHVPDLIEKIWVGENRGRLKPLMDALSDKPKEVNYTQLRVYLTQQGYMSAIQ